MTQIENILMQLNKVKVTSILLIILLISVSNVQALFFSQLENKTYLNNKNDYDERFFDFKMNFYRVLGSFPSLSTCIIKDDRVVWSRSYGYSNVYKRNLASTDTIYSVGSISKTILTTGFLQLYENESYGVDLDDDVNKYLPFSLSNPKYPNVNITIRMLLSHRSSIFDYFGFSLKGLVFDMPKVLDFPEDLGEWLRNILVPGGSMYREEYWLDFPPGESACYSSIGFFVVSYLFEIIAGEKIEDYFQRNIFEPLGMKDTSYKLEELDQNKIATPYIKKLGFYIPLKNKDFKGFAGVGGLRTTLNDLSNFLIAHMNNGSYNNVRILKNETIKLMHNTIYPETVLTSAEGYYYGYGWWSSPVCGERLEGHGGKIPGCECKMVVNQSSKTGFILLSNHDNMFGDRLKEKIFVNIFSSLFEKAENY